MMKKLVLSLGVLLCNYLLFAQQSYTIKVIDSKTGNPIEGASVRLKTSRNGTSTNSNGNCSIQANANDILEITSIGFTSQSLKLGNQTAVTIAMEPVSIDVGEVVVVGSRGAARAKTETAVPVDVIKINQVGLPTAKMDLTSVLNVAEPSFNYNKQSGADGADHIDIGTLRGLGPDHTLVLINGKRRHPTAFVGLFGTRGRANSGVDMNGFPEASVDRIEILRDGASAQYGSDAIAGVINIILKKDINHWSINAGWSGYYDYKYNSRKFNAGNQYYSGNAIDGNTFSFSANNGAAIGKNGGFINFSLDFITQAKTFRQVDTLNWQTKKYALPYLNTGRRAYGDGSITSAGGFFIMEIPSAAKGKTTFYSFGGYNYKASDAFAYSRNWSAKPERFPVDAGGNRIDVPSIMRTSNDAEVYYNPHIQTHITDASLAAGVRGSAGNEWNWDVSNTLGYNNFNYFGDKTFNASQIGKATPTHFDDGGFNFLQNTVNVDLNKPFKSVGEGFNLGVGAEFRYERYTIYSGEDLSYKNYDPNGMQA